LEGPKRNQKVLAPSYGLRCAQVPSLRSCSVGTASRAIHGPSRLSRHPCRSTHSTEPPLGLPGGLADQKHCATRRPTGRPVLVTVCARVQDLFCFCFCCSHGIAQKTGMPITLPKSVHHVPVHPSPCVRTVQVLPQGTPRKVETNTPVRHKCRICTRWVSYLKTPTNPNNAPVANQARAASVRYQRIQRLVDITLGQLHQVHSRQHQIARGPAQAIPRLIRAGARAAQQV